VGVIVGVVGLVKGSGGGDVEGEGTWKEGRRVME
jgi:hypothetical protein